MILTSTRPHVVLLVGCFNCTFSRLPIVSTVYVPECLYLITSRGCQIIKGYMIRGIYTVVENWGGGGRATAPPLLELEGQCLPNCGITGTHTAIHMCNLV